MLCLIILFLGKNKDNIWSDEDTLIIRDEESSMNGYYVEHATPVKMKKKCDELTRMVKVLAWDIEHGMALLSVEREESQHILVF